MYNIGRRVGKVYQLHGRSIGHSLVLYDASRHDSWIDGGKRAQYPKISSDTDWPGLGTR